MVVVSAVICTHNQSRLLSMALDRLVGQSANPSHWEIVVIDNASTDTTAEVVRSCINAHSELSIRYVYEPKLGLSNARNTGYQCARGQYIAYLDDDALAPRDWIDKIIQLAEETSPGPDCIGGKIVPFYLSPRPAWFRDAYETFTLGDDKRPLRPGEVLSGSNMVWRREAIETVGGFNPQLGVSGDDLSVGEETAVFLRLWKSDQPFLLYDPRLAVEHYVPATKMTVRYRLRRAFVAGRDWHRTVPAHLRPARYKMLILAPASLIKMAVGAVARLLRRPGVSTALQEAERIVNKLGALATAAGINVRVQQVRKEILSPSSGSQRNDRRAA